jgi:beta-xylosidase
MNQNLITYLPDKILSMKIMLLSFFLLSSQVHAQETGKWGDQGNGMFRNPIIAGDYSDPDPIRVGEEYYMAVSTFESSPGVTILQSKDLVNWEYSGSVFSDLTKVKDAFRWDQMERYGEGAFAPSLRYHENKFWVFVNFYTDGFYMATTKHPSDKWEIHQIKDKKGRPLRTLYWTDPCPFWDDNGKAYLASSRPGDAWYGYLFEMTPDGRQLLDADVDHMNEEDIEYKYPKGGTLYSPFQSTEGNKIYKRNGFYYLIHIEFLPDGQGCGTYVMRSKHIYGLKSDGTPGGPGNPGKYEIYKIGEDGCEGINQEFPGQGGLVNTPDDRWFWIGQFNRINIDKYRVPHLIPVTWIDDWPVFGADVRNGKGYMKWELPKPIDGFPMVYPFISDEFDTADLNPVWQWNHQPDKSKWTLSEHPGFLRMYAGKTSNFFKAPNTINQRHFKSDSTFVTIKILTTGMTDGQQAGLSHFTGGTSYAKLGIEMNKGKKRLVYEMNGKTSKIDKMEADSDTLYLRTRVKMDNRVNWYYSYDGESYKSLKKTYAIESGNFRGNMVGIFTYNTVSESGYIDVDWFEYLVHNK